MSYVTEPFQAYLSAPLEADEVYLPLGSSAYTDLLKLLKPEETYTYLTIKDDTHVETVKAYVTGNYIILDRGQANTTATKFSYGACVTTVFPTLLAVIEDYVTEKFEENCDLCSYHEEPDAMCTPLGEAMVNLPDGEVGKDYYGYIILSGVLPIQVQIMGAPSWMTIKQVHNMIDLTGIPRESSTHTLKLLASNCNGSYTIDATHEITIS